MHLTQHQSSDDISRNKAVHYTQLTNGFYHKFNLDISGDKRLDGLVTELQGYIKKQTDRHRPPTEEQIATKTVQLIHSDKYYGPYNRQLERLQNRLDDLESESDRARRHGKTNEADKLDAQYNQTLTASNALTHEINGRGHLRDLRKGELFCAHEAAIASYALHKVGIRNDFCAGLTPGGGQHVDNHAFVQIRKSRAYSHAEGDVADATDPKAPYYRSDNHGLISRGEVAITHNTHNGARKSYGGGNISGWRALSYTFSADKDHDRDILDNAARHNDRQAQASLGEDRAKADAHRHVASLQKSGVVMHDGQQNDKKRGHGVHGNYAQDNSRTAPVLNPRG